MSNFAKKNKIENINEKETKNMSVSGSGIAFDKVTQQVVVKTSDSSLRVYPYTYFSGDTSKSVSIKLSASFGGIDQDIGAYNGVTYICNSPSKAKSYMDCYDTGTGKYLGSYYLPDIPELESIDFVGGTIYGCGATKRRFIHLKMAASLQGSKANIKGDKTSTDSGATGNYTTDEKVARNALIKKYGNEAKVYFTLRDDGYSHVGACAIMGNIMQESGFRISAISYDGMGSYGICQWTGPRKTNLKEWCKKNNLKSDSIEGQTKFLEHELKSYETLNAKLKRSDDSLKTLTELFETKFERAGVPRMENRNKYAKEFYDRYKPFAGAKFTGMQLDDGTQPPSGGGTLVAHVEQLVSSANYKWVIDGEEDHTQIDKTNSIILDRFNDQLKDAFAVWNEH